MPRGVRGRSTFGSVAQLGPGRWRLRWWQDGPDGRKRRSEVVRGTRRDAERRLAEIRLESERPDGTVAPTVGQLWSRRVLPAMERRAADGRMSANTLKTYRSQWSARVRDRWGDVPVTQVKAADVRDWLQELPRPTAQTARSVLSAVLDEAVMMELVDVNRARARMELPPDRRESPAAPTVAELLAMVAAVRGTPVEAAAILGGCAGLRAGESLGVMASEVELRDAHGVPFVAVEVVRQVGQGGDVSERLKTQQSRRVAVVCGPPAARLAQIAGDCAANSWPWLCDDGFGAPVSYKRAARMFRDSGATVPLGKLRNAWETHWRWLVHLPQPCIERLMGHAGATVTDRHYDRPLGEMVVCEAVDAYALAPIYDGFGSDV